MIEVVLLESGTKRSVCLSRSSGAGEVLVRRLFSHGYNSKSSSCEVHVSAVLLCSKRHRSSNSPNTNLFTLSEHSGGGASLNVLTNI